MTPEEQKAFQMIQENGLSEALKRSKSNLETEQLASFNECFDPNRLMYWYCVTQILEGYEG